MLNWKECGVEQKVLAYRLASFFNLVEATLKAWLDAQAKRARKR